MFDGQCGAIYGNHELTPIYLGSGGGGCKRSKGTNGGGIVIIKCSESIFVGKDASITANGGKFGLDVSKSHDVPGCGSGGSIYIKAPKIENYGTISAVGGYNIKDGKHCDGSGGYGRIRFDCNKENTKYFQKLFGYNGIIEPKIGCLKFF